MLTKRAEIDHTFAEAAGSGETLSVDQLVTFLKHQQREEAAGPVLALSLIERYEPSETGEGLARACCPRAIPGRESLGETSPREGSWRGAGCLSQHWGPWPGFACPMQAGLQYPHPSLGPVFRGF